MHKNKSSPRFRYFVGDIRQAALKRYTKWHGYHIIVVNAFGYCAFVTDNA